MWSWPSSWLCHKKHSRPQLKFGKLRPLLTKPSLNHTQFLNYRPVSNLTFISKEIEKSFANQLGCLPFDRKIRLGCRKHNGKRFTSLRKNCHIRFVLNPKEGRICVAWVWNREGTEKLVNGKQHSVWFVPTGMKGLPQNVLLNFRLEFPKSDLTIYLPSGISEIFCQMVSNPDFLY